MLTAINALWFKNEAEIDSAYLVFSPTAAAIETGIVRVFSNPDDAVDELQNIKSVLLR